MSDKKWTYKSKTDFTLIVRPTIHERRIDSTGGIYDVPIKPIKVKFIQNTFILTESVAKKFGCSAEDIALMLKESPFNGRNFKLVEEPDIPSTDEQKSFAKQADDLAETQGPIVTQGARVTGARMGFKKKK